ncbi:hypothetical protein [Streptomyces sp. NPDC006285]|uniref:hypothetical protein n=1 Tax=Streptomyces sp. NPDC006285 TaxID=3364742 RepID=UPI0036A3C062
MQASGGLGDLSAPVLSLTAGDVERPGLLGYIMGLRFIRLEAFDTDTDAAVTATELLRFGHSWAAVHSIHAARPSSPAHPSCTLNILAAAAQRDRFRALRTSSRQDVSRGAPTQ